MASGVFRIGAHKLADRTIDFVGSSSVKAILVDTTFVFDITMSSLTSNGAGAAGANIAAHEVSPTGYTGGFGGSGRKSLSSKAINLDTTNNRIVWTCAAVVWTAIGGAVNDDVGGVVIAYELTNDGASYPMFWVDSNDLNTNGSDLTYTPNGTNGVGYTQL